MQWIQQKQHSEAKIKALRHCKGARGGVKEVMVWRNLGKTTTRRRNKVNNLISFLLVLLFSLMFDVFSGGDGRRTGYGFVEGAVGKSDGGSGAIFWITGGGVGASGASGSQSNVGIAIAMTVMAGLAVAATLVYSNR